MIERRPGLDLLRACAIVSVVLAHGLLFLYPHVPWLGYLGHLGSYGVDLFFVLSGFLIGAILWRHGDEMKSPRVLVGFWIRRWMRTLPNYFLFVGVNALVFHFVYRYPLQWRGEVAAYTVFLQNLTQPPGVFFKESWTLAIEEWFYLLFPLGLCLGRGVFRAPWRVCWLVLLGVMLLGPLWRRWALPDGTDWGQAVRMPVVQRLDSVAFGIAAAYVAARWPLAWGRWRVPLAWTGLVLLVPCYIMLFLVDLKHSWFVRTLWFDVVGLSFAFLLPWADRALAVPARSTVAALARWSYSMYLTNLLLLGLGVHLWIETTRTSAWAAIAVFCGYWGVCLGASAFIYRWYEKPVMELRDRFKVCRVAATPTGLSQRGGGILHDSKIRP